MNIYYTAKDIEELVAKGVRQLELGPNTSLTDFARETAEQLDLVLIDKTQQKDQVQPPVPAPPTSAQAVQTSRSYNKPRGCQPDQPHPLAVVSQEPDAPGRGPEGESSGPVNRLVDLMGRIINRGD